MELKEKKVLVTGSDGFIGSHLVEMLIREGCIVSAGVVYNSFNSWGWLEAIPQIVRDKIKIIQFDIRDSNAVNEIVQDCDIIFHLAALIAIPFSYTAPESFIDTNVKGTLNILQAARKSKCSKIILTSTSEVYGTAKYVPIDEKHPLQGQSPYSASKIGSDKLGEAFFRSFDLPLVIARPFNTYGPRQSARAVIPTIISQLLAGFSEVKLGSLTPTRDLNYVQDTCRGFIALAKSDDSIGEEVNIASQTEISVADLANTIIQQINPKAQIVSDEDRLRPEKSEVNRLFGSNEKIKTLTGWQSQVSLEVGIARTIEWFRDPQNLARYKPHIYNK